MFNHVVYLIFLLLICHNISSGRSKEDDGLAAYMGKCCQHGIKHARKYDHCQNYEYEVNSIPRLWIGLCRSTYSVCCSRQSEEQDCLTGRMAAMTGSDCSRPGKMNVTNTAYKDCCGWCQLGLAVKASSSSCDDALFTYFNEMESYRICCGNFNKTNNNNNNNNKQHHEEEHVQINAESSDNVADGTIVLQDDDDDICSKVPNLCQHICENTLEAYRCKCHAGYNLNADNVTCSLISVESLSSAELDKFESISEKKNENLDDDDNNDNNNNNNWNEDSLEFRDNLCPLGYVYDKITRKCVDLDECAIKGMTTRCEDNQFCHNTIGSYHCLNREPPSDNSEEVCEDCDEGYTCVKYAGRYKCVVKCIDGFQLVNDTCHDIDECSTDESACSGNNQTCINEKGGYRCECKVGFRFDTAENECVDINECSINNHDCLATQRCDNTLGSYVCTRLQSCGTGYTLDADTGNCMDNDECKLNTHNCPTNYECHNTQGSFRCYRRVTTTTSTTTTTTTSTTTPRTTTTTARTTTSARDYDYKKYWERYQNRSDPSYSSQTYARNYARENNPNYITSDLNSQCPIGFARNELGACTDVNECLIYQPCRSHQRCINSNGSFRCQNRLECSSGFKATPDGSRCVDIDECETGEHNCAGTQMCHNRHGGFICKCPAGYQLKAMPPSGVETCVDINECEQERPSVCPLYSECLNTVGSYYCDCKSGFKKDATNDRLCIDVDECQELPGLCQHKCNNNWGGYYCSCNSGYELGYDNRTCADIDECEVYKNNELCMGFCSNVPGSYDCSCPRGYALQPDKVNCRDIDECATGDFCTGRHDICTNTHGSYRCTTIRCPYGYKNDANQKNLCIMNQQYCNDESCYSKPSAYTHYFITLTSNLPVQPEGRRIFILKPNFNGNVDFQLKLTKVQAAANIEQATDHHFDTQKEDTNQLIIRLRKPLEGPQDVELELSMTVFRHGIPSGKSVTKILIIVSQYKF